MSTLDELINQGKLAHLAHSKRSFCLNSIYCTKKLFDERFQDDNLGFKRAGMKNRKASLLVSCERFMSGDEDLENLFKNLTKPSSELVELKIIEPRPGLRIIGGFYSENIFIALEIKLREDFSSQNVTWKSVINRCEESWRHLFQEQQPIKPKGSEKWNIL